MVGADLARLWCVCRYFRGDGGVHRRLQSVVSGRRQRDRQRRADSARAAGEAGAAGARRMTARKTTITVASAAALAAALPMVKHYEGLWLTVKPDTLARGLPTGGYGETEDVRLGETH